MTKTAASNLLTLVSIISHITPAAANTFLVQKVDTNGKDFKADIQAALSEALLGCGGEVHPERTSEIEKALNPMWQTLPKNEHGRIERRSLRHAVHRYFMQKSSIMIRGFEPSRPVNQSHWGVADILHQQVPGYVEAHLESRHAQEKGFSLQDAVSLVTMLEQLIYDSDRALLDKVYGEQRKSTHQTVSYQGLKQILEEYIVHWMVGHDPESAETLLRDRKLCEEHLPHWHGLVEFVLGQAKALEFQRQQAPEARRGVTYPRKNALSMRFSFDEVHEIVGGITRTFASFWESECLSMKMGLVNMDTHATGRVPLSRFYGTALDSEWRFGESEEYLREMGVLDETSRWKGKQVIIPNYMHAASNCIVATQHYLVCCVNECESLLSEIEARIAGPTATPAEILAIVHNMSSPLTIDDDTPLHVDKSLVSQLEQVGASNGGKVPLHGRLFAQWLHYVFPRECPFPHKTGVAASVTPLEFGDGYLATSEDMQKHASDDVAATVPSSVGKEELQWMSQWSSEEELTLDYSMELQAPWEQHHSVFTVVSVVLLVAGLWFGVFAMNRKTSDTGASMDFGKVHLV